MRLLRWLMLTTRSIEGILSINLGTRIGEGTGRANALRNLYQFSIPNGRGSMETTSRMDHPRVHVAVGMR
jgi:hypothetical protein